MTSICFTGFAFATTLFVASTPTADDGVKPGDRPAYTWQQELVNGQGVKSLADLRGRPVIVDFWGTNCPPCVGTAVPMALKMQEEFGDDVQIILVESQNHSLDEVRSFALGKKWSNNRVIWTTEAPFSTGKTWIPCCVVLGNEGEVLINDNPCSAHSTIEDLIAEQLKLAKKGAKGTSATLAKALADYESGSCAAAIKSLEGIADGPDKEAAKKLAATLNTRLKARLARAEWCFENAEFEAADKLVAQLLTGAKDHAIGNKVADLAGRLAAKEMATEREAAKTLDRIRKKLAKDGLDDAARKQLNGLSEKFPTTKAARVASDLAKLTAS